MKYINTLIHYILWERATNPGINTGDWPKPFNKNPNIIKLINLGIGGQGYKNKHDIDETIRPKLYIV